MINNFQALKNKITNKLFGAVRVPAMGKRKGSVVLSYLTEPFTLNSSQPLSTYHSSYWECREIAFLFSKKGYEVDVIKWDNTAFIPRKKYAVCVDIQKNLSRLAPLLNPECKKVMHIVSSHWKFQNEAEQKRLNELSKRRGIQLRPHRTESPSQNIEAADFVEGLGNKTTFDTYAFANKPIFPINASPAVIFPDLSRNIQNARNNFLFLGGGGMMLKGLDRVLEAFAKMPTANLTVCGPVEKEKDFFDFYKKELINAKNVSYKGRIDQGSNVFREIASSHIAMVYPSASEGCAGAVVTALHAGMIVIASRNCGIDVDRAGGFILETSEPDEIELVTRKVQSMDISEMARRSKVAKSYAETHFTREAFLSSYEMFIDTVLKL